MAEPTEHPGAVDRLGRPVASAVAVAHLDHGDGVALSVAASQEPRSA